MACRPNVKRVVITSSIAAIQVPRDPPCTFTEKDWNTYSIDLVEKEGKNAPPVHQYQASKTLAERAAWDFVKEKKGKINFDLVSINPSWVSQVASSFSDSTPVLTRIDLGFRRRYSLSQMSSF